MKNWVDNGNGTVTLEYADGFVIVSKEDFNRAFGTMLNSTKQEVEHDFALKQ